MAVFLTSFLATSFTWDLEPQTMNLQLEFETFGFLMGLIAFLVWAIIAAAAYAISTGERESSLGADRGIVRASLNVGYGVLLVLQIVCIYLTQSRGPWLCVR